MAYSDELFQILYVLRIIYKIEYFKINFNERLNKDDFIA